MTRPIHPALHRRINPTAVIGFMATLSCFSRVVRNGTETIHPISARMSGEDHP